MQPEIRFLLFRHASESLTLADGKQLFAIGDNGDAMYVVKSGCIKLTRDGEVLEQVEEGDIFGELALIDEGVRGASAIACGDTEVVPVNRKRFRFLVQADPDFSLEVMRVITKRLRRYDTVSK